MSAEVHIEFCSKRIMSAHCWHRTNEQVPAHAAQPFETGSSAICCYCGDKRRFPYLLAHDAQHGTFRP